MVKLVREISAGLTVGLVALPLALAFGIAGGATAAAGLYTAIVAGLVSGLCGGSKYQISGPTGAMSVILVGVVAKYGISGMLAAGLLAGVLQILMGLLGLGKLVKLIPNPVITGFTNGIAIVIVLGQLKYITTAPFLTVLVAATILLVRRVNKTIPASLFGLAVGIGANLLFGWNGPTVQAIEPALPKFGWPNLALADLVPLFEPALAIALLGTIESLLSAAVADSMTGTVHNSNRELVGQGLGNIAAALVGGVPSTGAIARTAVNIQNGGSTRLVHVVHSLFLLAVLLFLGPWTAFIPLAALSGILVVTSYDMFDFQTVTTLRKSSTHDAVILLATMVLTVCTNLVVAVGAGIVLAALIQCYHSKTLRILPLNANGNGNIQIFSLQGALHFGTVVSLNKALRQVKPGGIVILDLSGLTMLDQTGVIALSKLQQSTEQTPAARIILCGLHPEYQSLVEAAGGIPTDQISRDLAQTLALAEG